MVHNPDQSASGHDVEPRYRMSLIVEGSACRAQRALTRPAGYGATADLKRPTSRARLSIRAVAVRGVSEPRTRS